MPRKTEEQLNREALADINGEKESLAKKLKRTAGRVALVGAVSAAGVFGIDRSPESTESGNLGQGAGQTAGQEFVPQKGGDVITDDQGNQLQIIRDEEGNFVEFRNLETGETSQAEIADALSFDNPESEETETYENSEAFKNGGGMPDLREEPSNPEAEIYENSEEFTNNDGHKAAKIEREVNNPEG